MISQRNLLVIRHAFPRVIRIRRLFARSKRIASTGVQKASARGRFPWRDIIFNKRTSEERIALSVNESSPRRKERAVRPRGESLSLSLSLFLSSFPSGELRQ